MSLENAILEHAKALNNLADAINNSKSNIQFTGFSNPHIISENSPKISDLKDSEEIKDNDVVLTDEEKKPKRTRKTKNVEPVEVVIERIKQTSDIIDVTNDQQEFILTADSLKEAANLRIAEGFDRLEIKKEIINLGFEKISDMDKNAMIKFNSFLKSLKK